MNGIQIRSNTVVAASLVAAGAVMAAIGGASVDHQVASVLPPMGAALVAGGLVLLTQTTPLSGPENLILGVALVMAGVVIAVIGSDTADAAVRATLPPIGAALVTGGIPAIARGAALAGSRAGLGAR